MNNDERYLEILKLQRETQQKYVYYILAINAAAIGYTIGLDKSPEVECVFIFHIIALVAWSFSFWFGCNYILKIILVNQINLKKLETNDINKKEKYAEMMHLEGMKAAKRFNLMLYLLVLGCFMFITWYVLSKFI